MSVDTKEILKSPLEQMESVDVIERPNYTEAEEKYLGGLKTRLENARNARDSAHDEFDGMDYVTYYNLNEQLANNYTGPKRNKEDTTFQSGIVRTKLFSLLSSLVNLNLTGDISAFDKNGLRVQALGDAMEDVILKTKELDGDDEKKLLRQYELLKHGTVFVEELWDKKKKIVKKTKKEFDGKLNSADWDKKLEDAFSRPTRNIIPGINVYLGDITKYNISEQPFIFTVDSMPYEEAKMIFGTWERWKNVPKKYQPEVQSGGLYDWRLVEKRENHVDIVRYQDKWNNEFAVLLNGILMTPQGLPLPWGYEEYNVAQQNLEPIHAKFAYGRSLVSRLRNKSALLDEMIRLAVLKSQKSFMPPKFNLTGRVVSSRVFMPGKVTHGIDPRLILNADDKETQGVTNSEMAMIQKIEESIDFESVSPTFQGQQGKGDQTATEIIQMQRQAKLMLGLTIFACSMLEWKLEWLRLQNVLARWFDPEDEVVDTARGMLKGKYRTVSVERGIEGEGQGLRMVIPTKEIPSSQSIKKAEDILSEEQGRPVRMIFVNPEEVTSSKLVWQIVVTPKERTTSEAQKLLFRAEMQDATMFGPLLNMDYWMEKFANTWGENPKKAFKSATENQGMMPGSAKTVSPNVNLPTPEKAAGNELRNELGVSA